MNNCYLFVERGFVCLLDVCVEHNNSNNNYSFSLFVCLFVCLLFFLLEVIILYRCFGDCLLIRNEEE